MKKTTEYVQGGDKKTMDRRGSHTEEGGGVEGAEQQRPDEEDARQQAGGTHTHSLTHPV